MVVDDLKLAGGRIAVNNVLRGEEGLEELPLGIELCPFDLGSALLLLLRSCSGGRAGGGGGGVRSPSTRIGRLYDTWSRCHAVLL